MDFYTKMFLVNWVILIFMALIDRKILDDAIEDGKYTKHLWSIWNVVTVLSVPVWVVYLIVTW